MNRERLVFEHQPESEDFDSDDIYAERRRKAAQAKNQIAANVNRLSQEDDRKVREKKIAEETLARLRKLPPNPKFENK